MEAIFSNLDQTEIESETRLSAEIFADAPCALGDSVACDQQKEPTGFEITRHTVHELGFAEGLPAAEASS